ncbi:MAG: tyrosine-type recombinase/integrase [Alphaproteobacteria bacterium]
MYASRRRPPKTLTEVEQAALLKVSGEHAKGFRDHVIFSVAIGTGLRESEILALNIGDILNANGQPKRRVELRVFKRCTKSPMPQEVFLPDGTRYKLGRYLKWKKKRGESIDPGAPLFVSRKGNRLSARQLRDLFKTWQKRADFDRVHTFHALRHTACTNLYRQERDIRLVQRFARHANIATTTIYAAPTDEDLLRAVRGLNS